MMTSPTIADPKSRVVGSTLGNVLSAFAGLNLVVGLYADMAWPGGAAFYAAIICWTVSPVLAVVSVIAILVTFLNKQRTAPFWISFAVAVSSGLLPVLFSHHS